MRTRSFFLDACTFRNYRYCISVFVGQACVTTHELIIGLTRQSSTLFQHERRRHDNVTGRGKITYVESFVSPYRCIRSLLRTVSLLYHRVSDALESKARLEHCWQLSFFFLTSWLCTWCRCSAALGNKLMFSHLTATTLTLLAA